MRRDAVNVRAVISNLARLGLISTAKEVAASHHVSVSSMLKQGKGRTATRARDAFVYALRQAHGFSHPELGSLLDRDQSSMRIAILRHAERLAAANNRDGAPHNSVDCRAAL